MQATLIVAFLLLCVICLVAVGPRRIAAAPIPALTSPRPVAIWTAWIGGVNLAVNAVSLVCFIVVFPSITAALLFWLMPYSLLLGSVGVTLYVRERHAVSKSSAPPPRWAVTLVLSLAIVVFGLVVLCIVLFHGAQLGNSLDPGGL